MPDKPDSTDSDVEAALVPVATGTGLVPREEAALVTVADSHPRAIMVQGLAITVDEAHSQDFRVLTAVPYGIALLASLPAWNQRKYGDLNYPNFKILLGAHLSIVPAHVESTIGNRLSEGMDAQQYCLTMYVLYQQAQASRGPIEPEAVAPREPAPAGDSSHVLLKMGAAIGLAVAVCCSGVVVKNCGTSEAPVPVAAKSVPVPTPVPAVPFRPTSLTHLVDVSKPESNPLSRADLDFLEGCGAEGYVLVQCKGGALYNPQPTTYFLTDEPSDFVINPRECSEIIYKGHSSFFGPCGESFVQNERGTPFEWEDERVGTVRKGSASSQKLDYRQIYPSPFAVCSDAGDVVFLAPIVPIAAENVAENCVAHPIRPITQ